MANATSKIILLDGNRNAIVRFAGVLDTADVIDTVTLANFTNNDRNNKFVGFRVNRLRFAIDPNLGVSLFWNASTPRLIAGLAGTGKMDLQKSGGLQPVQADAGFDGAINFATNGYATRESVGTKANYFVDLELTKLYT